MRKPRAGAVASCLLVALIALGASGCSGEPEEATASPAATSSAEPAPDVSAVPETEVAPDAGAAPGDDATPDPGAVPSDDPVPGAEVAPAAPVLPVAATVPDAAGAQAFVKYWYELINHAYAIGDGNVLGPLSHPECTSCVSTVENIAKGVDAGGVFRDLVFLPEQLDTVPKQLNTVTPAADVMLTTGLLICPPRGAIIYPDGTVLDTDCTEVRSMKVISQWSGDHWQIREIGYPDEWE